MSNINPQDYKVLSDSRFAELCSILGVTKQCCFAPEQKVIEKSFRKKALKCHPDKGGDAVIFKKLNDAYNKLIGHCRKLEQQVEAEELSNSILIEISKSSVTAWHEKLHNRYGWFKSENCKNIIFEGPYKQYMGRSINTGNLTIVLYEDPPDAIPKIHVRSKKYMAWIAENNLPVHMHVEKGKVLQFDQWRIAHLAEFGINNLDNAPTTPAPARVPKTPKSKRKDKERRDNSERRAKTRRDSEPNHEAEKGTKQENMKETLGNDKENQNPTSAKFGSLFDSLSCGQCGAGFANLMEYIGHKKVCVPDEDFSRTQEAVHPQPSSDNKEESRNDPRETDKATNNATTTQSCDNTEQQSDEVTESVKKKENAEKKTEAKLNPSFISVTDVKKNSSTGLCCDKCDEKFTSMVKYEKHRAECSHSKLPDLNNADIPMESLLINLPDSQNIEHCS